MLITDVNGAQLNADNVSFYDRFMVGVLDLNSNEFMYKVDVTNTSQWLMLVATAVCRFKGCKCNLTAFVL